MGARPACLHDFDYERYPSAEDHPFKGSEILRSAAIRKTSAVPSCRTPTTAA